MVMSKEQTVAGYLASLPPDRRKAIATVRKEIKRNLPKGFAEGMLYGMISYYVPPSKLGETYNGQPLCIAGLAAQVQYNAVYLNVYADPKTERWFKDEYRRSGKRLDMGKSCVRFKTLDDLPLELVGEVIAMTSMEDYVGQYLDSHRGQKSKPIKKSSR